MKHYLLLLITISLCFPDSGYNTIYLMEFDNLKNDFTNSHLQVALPDLIKENYKFRHIFYVESDESSVIYNKFYIIAPSNIHSVQHFRPLL